MRSVLSFVCIALACVTASSSMVVPPALRNGGGADRGPDCYLPDGGQTCRCREFELRGCSFNVTNCYVNGWEMEPKSRVCATGPARGGSSSPSAAGGYPICAVSHDRTTHTHTEAVALAAVIDEHPACLVDEVRN